MDDKMWQNFSGKLRLADFGIDEIKPNPDKTGRIWFKAIFLLLDVNDWLTKFNKILIG